MKSTKLLMFTLCIHAGVFLPQAVNAIFVKQELVKVPIRRLIKNFERAISRDSQNARYYFGLARLYSMAYAQKENETNIPKSKSVLGKETVVEPAYRDMGSHMEPASFHVVKTTNFTREKEAFEHLKKAVSFYQQGLELDSENLYVRLGYAWCFDQQGNQQEAVKEYRIVFEKAWEKEKDKKTLEFQERDILAETVSYLIPLLDPVKDAEEINRIKAQVKTFRKVVRLVTPIFIPLRKELSNFTSMTSRDGARFDLDGTGMEEWEWVSKDAGLLVYDADGSGKIESGLQLFGSVTFWIFWDNGYQALSALDDDGDGKVSGQEFDHLAVWQDSNGNGASDPGEVKPLGEWGIESLNCKHETHSSGIPFSPEGVTFRDGAVRPTFDIYLKSRNPDALKEKF